MGLFFHQLRIKINIEKKDDPSKCLKCKISAFGSHRAPHSWSHLFLMSNRALSPSVVKTTNAPGVKLSKTSSFFCCQRLIDNENIFKCIITIHIFPFFSSHFWLSYTLITTRRLIMPSHRSRGWSAIQTGEVCLMGCFMLYSMVWFRIKDRFNCIRRVLSDPDRGSG